MNPKLPAVVAALLIASFPAAAPAQDAADTAQSAAWHNAQSLALASRHASEGWSYLPGGLLWRRVGGTGAGERPAVQDTVTIHYRGTFVDGEEFDSSYRRNQPATFPLGGLIRAWQLAVPMMAVGDTIEIAAPATLAYGPQGRGPIPGGATLLFTIELLGIAGR